MPYLARLLLCGQLLFTAEAIARVSYKCSEEEKQFVFDNIDIVNPSICDGPYIYQLAQLSYPSWRTFIDVGTNVGYTTARIFGLWSPGSGLNPSSLFQAHTSDAKNKLRGYSGNLMTNCGEGASPTTIPRPLTCPGQPLAKRERSDPCLIRLPITVYGFEGSEIHVNGTRGVIARHFSHLEAEYKPQGAETTKATWHLANIAVTSSERATKSPVGYFQQFEHEGGKLMPWINGSSPPTNEKLIQITSIDTFCENNNIQVVDVLKIDAENTDHEVILGSLKTLHSRRVKLIEFEGNLGNAIWQNLISLLDLKYNFDCFLSGRSGVVARVTNCYNQSIVDNATRPRCNKTKCTEENNNRYEGNGYCVSRHYAPLLLRLVDDISIHQYFNNKRGDLFFDNLVGLSEATIKNGKTFTMTENGYGILDRSTGRDRNFTKKWH